MGHRREAARHAAALSRPSASELGVRNRNSGLGQTLRVHDEDPPADAVGLPYAWVSLQDATPRIKAYDADGALWQLSMTKVT